MQSFEIKRGHGKSLEDGGLKGMMEDEFGEVEIPENSIFIASFEALKSIRVEYMSNTEIRVETETDIEATPESSLEAHQAYNRFMQTVTGFNAKQRVDRAKAKAKKEAKAAAEREMTKTSMLNELKKEETNENIEQDGNVADDTTEEVEQDGNVADEDDITDETIKQNEENTS